MGFFDGDDVQGSNYDEYYYYYSSSRDPEMYFYEEPKKPHDEIKHAKEFFKNENVQVICVVIIALLVCSCIIYGISKVGDNVCYSG